MFLQPKTKNDALLCAAFLALSAVLYFLPTGFEAREDESAVRCEGTVLAVDDTEVRVFGIVRQGDQEVTMRLEDGPFEGRVVTGVNQLMGHMDRDKLFCVGDSVLVVLSLNTQGEIMYVNPQDHYRLGLELGLLSAFAVLLVGFGGWTGLKALLSFVFSAMTMWKVLVPCLLNGYDPLLVCLAVVALLTGAIIFLVAGLTRMGCVACAGALLGVGLSSLMALYCTGGFHISGAVLPFAETLLYSGFGHLDLDRIYVAAVFLAASGAVMDLAMDVAASQNEVVRHRPGIGFFDALGVGFRVGRPVLGTMTTTLLLAYSGGYVTLLMAFMAQGVPLANLFNLNYVAAELLKTVVGSFGLVTVAPFTALAGALLFSRANAGRGEDDE